MYGYSLDGDGHRSDYCNGRGFLLVEMVVMVIKLLVVVVIKLLVVVLQFSNTKSDLWSKASIHAHHILNIVCCFEYVLPIFKRY